MIARILLFLSLFVMWLVLTWPVHARDIITGSFVSLIVCALTMDLLITGGHIRRPLIRYAWFIYYVCIFLWECIKANIDVAVRVLHPDMPIRPCTVKVRTCLRSDVALTFLANSITLTPGTTTIDIDQEKGYIYVHKLFVRKGEDPHVSAGIIVGKFERILRKVFE